MNEAAILEVASALARKFEGFYPRPYLCPAGVPTVGYGSTFYEDGTRVTLADPPITRERAEQLLQHELRRVSLRAVRRYCPGIDTEDRAAAITDFVFNLGAGRLQTSTLRKRIAAGDWDQVPAELMKWSRAGGRVLLGLLARRQAEAALI